jgi:RNA polymerase sigma factor (sigma-70 family)
MQDHANDFSNEPDSAGPGISPTDDHEANGHGTCPQWFQQFYNTTVAKVIRYLRSRGVREERAEELAQRIFVRLFEQFPEVRNPEAWAISAAKYAVISEFKSNGHSYRLSEAGLQTLVASDSDDPQIRAENEEMIAIIRQDCCRDDVDRDVFRLYMLENYSLRDASAALDITLGQGQNRWRGILKRIQARFSCTING